MKNLHENFAAIAVMGELYEAGKDIYDVLAAYLKMIVISESMTGFTSAEITDRINKANSFKVNESIVKTALRRLKLPKNHGVYSVPEYILNSPESDELKEQIRQNKLILDQLCSFVEIEIGRKLNNEDAQELQNQFYKYLMSPEYIDTYSVYINQFVVQHSLDSSFHTAIIRIKEGLLVYEGISFSPEFGQTGKWDFPLDIVLEMEVIFFIVGYNGELHKEIYGQLLEYVSEINSLKNRKFISLQYTQDVKDEIENYFSTAERVYEKHEIVDPSKKAMQYILEGVHSKSDIQLKKVRLFSLLSSMGILENNIDFYSKENQIYNAVGPETYRNNCSAIDSERGEEYVIKCTDKVNQINILRKNQNKTLREAGCLLLTSNGTILKCAHMPDLYNEGDVPKAVTVDYLINRFWYKLNKGFGKGEGPKSIDIISRARMALATMSTSKVSQAYDDLKKQYAEGVITDVEVAEIMTELRKVSRNPEEFTSEQIDEQIAFIKDYDLTQRIEDVRREALARENDRETIAKLKLQIQKTEDKRLQETQERDAKEKEFEERIAALENHNTEMKNENKELADTVRYYVDKDKNRRRALKKLGRGIVFIFGLVIMAFLMFMCCRLLLKFDRSISGLISIALTLLFQFVTPLKKLWFKFVVNCEVNE